MRYLQHLKKTSPKQVIWAVTGMALLFSWLFTGYAHSYSDEESHIVFFVKKFPTFKVEFYNPDASESDYEPFNELPSEKKQAIADYCKYRFGVTSGQAEAIESCRKHASSYLK